MDEKEKTEVKWEVAFWVFILLIQPFLIVRCFPRLASNIPFLQAFGAPKKIDYSVKTSIERCGNCYGLGLCRYCKGTSRYGEKCWASPESCEKGFCATCHGAVQRTRHSQNCKACEATGFRQDLNQYCNPCGGDGVVTWYEY
jgi:hypothetical protein